MFSSALIAGLFGLAAAYTKPVGPEPIGNSVILPGLNDVVPVGRPFTITWQPTTTGTVTLLLLKGPSENAVPQYPIVEQIPNTGSYPWLPSTDLEPSENGKGYGIQLIDDATGQYQYSTQFGISNANYKKGGEKPPASPSTPPNSAAPAKPQTPEPKPASDNHAEPASVHKAAPVYGSAPTHENKAAPAYGSEPTNENQTAPVYHNKPAPYASGVSSAYAPRPTGYWTGSQNGTNAAPTGSKPSPSSTKTSDGSKAPAATYEGPAQQTGAASNVAISFFGLVAAGGAAILAI